MVPKNVAMFDKDIDTPGKSRKSFKEIQLESLNKLKRKSSKSPSFDDYPKEKKKKKSSKIKLFVD